LPPDPSLTPGGGSDVTVIALASIALTALLGLVTRLGDVLIKWVARRLRVPSDDRDEQIERLTRRLDQLERERDNE
jgi:hypothetical protein